VVTPLELFFDLVYVFAIGQLSHHLLEHVDLRTGAETAIIQRAERIGVELAGRAEDAGAVGWWGTWTVTLMVLALVGIAVGDELAIAHPSDDATFGFTLLTFGGPVLFLLAQIIFLRETLGHVPRSRPVGVVALAILAVATAPLTLIVGIAASTAVLVAVAVADTVHEDEQIPTSNRNPANTCVYHPAAGCPPRARATARGGG
jgi:low temperature requirement protein LtrA